MLEEKLAHKHLYSRRAHHTPTDATDEDERAKRIEEAKKRSSKIP